MGKGILDGIRVLELGFYIAAPLCGRILASQGAEVIRLLTGKAMDQQWTGGPQPVGSTVPDLEAMKRHITLDMRLPEGKRVARELIKISDVLVTNLTGEAIKRFDLEYPALKALNPKIIMVFQAGMGTVGPYKSYKAIGAMIASIVGLANVTGFPEGSPMMSGTAFCDYHESVYTALLVVAALQRRRQTGVGSFMEVSLYETGVSCLGVPILDYFANGRVAGRMGNRHPFASPHGAYPCRGDDRWCTIAVFTDKEWESFCRVTGNEALVTDPRFATLTDRLKNADELDNIVAGWTVNYPPEDVMRRMQEAGIPAGEVFRGQELIGNVHLKERGYYRETMYPVYPFDKEAAYAGPTLALPVPIGFSETPCQFGPTGRIPEDNDYVYGKLLKMSPEEIKRLTDEGVFV